MFVDMVHLSCVNENFVSSWNDDGDDEDCETPKHT